MMILGLDVSTSITGYCIMDTGDTVGHRLIKSDSIIIAKVKDPYIKSLMVRDEFKKLSKKFEIDKIVIEENLQAFRRGLSSARTLSTLARFNGIVTFLAQDVFGAPVEMINVNSARSLAGLKVDRKSEQTIKEQVLEWVRSTPEFQNFDWPTKTLKSGVRKGLTIDAPECFDIADAAVVCLAGLKLEQQNNTSYT
jgi:Holliday junction resolvasome RuvABC endonuclease subunit